MQSATEELKAQWQAFLPKSARLTADFLDAFMGLTLVDNPARLQDTRHWQSEFNGLCLKNLFAISQMQAQWLTPLGVPPELFQGWLKPLVQATQAAVANHRNPDLVAADNLRIESAYAAGIKQLVVFLTCEVPATEEEIARDDNRVNRHGRKLVFDRAICERLCTDVTGQIWLLSRLLQFQLLEWQYHSYGQTRLRAMKKLLRSLMQVITGDVLSDLKRHPYRKLSPEGERLQTDAEYLKECEERFLALLAHDAFDVRRFALESPRACLGACPWETVAGTEVYTARLRHYPRPTGVQPNGKTLYMATPMINRCELFDLAPGKSVVEGMLAQGYDIYMVDYGDPGPEQKDLDLSFYGQTLHDQYLQLLMERHPGQTIDVMGYCMGGTLFLPYLARRIQEAEILGETVPIHRVILMTTPVFFDDASSGHKGIRDVIREDYDPELMKVFFGDCNLAPEAIEAGMHAIQPGVTFNVTEGFYARANFPGAIDDSAPFMHWLNSGTRFPAKAHRQWLQWVFMENRIWEGSFCLPSRVAQLDGQPVDMDALRRGGVALFDYRGLRDPIAPPGSCRASERWGLIDQAGGLTHDGLNRTIERNVGHIFVVSKRLLQEFMVAAIEFLEGQPTAAPAAPAPAATRKPAAARRTAKTAASKTATGSKPAAPARKRTAKAPQNKA